MISYKVRPCRAGDAPPPLELSRRFAGISSVTTLPAVDATSDATLLARIRSGDAVALATVYRRHGAAVYRFACLHAGSQMIAADATQETFLWLTREGAVSFDPARSSLAAFLCGVARNHVLRIRAADARYTALPEHENSLADDDDRNAINDSLSHLLARERGDALLHALATLPAEQREVIALVEFEEFSYADAAAIIGCPVGTVRSRLFRAKAALKTQLLELFPVQQRISA